MVNSPIMQMFARSPFQPIQEHIIKAQACAVELKAFLKAVCDDDWEKAEKVQKKISGLEQDADNMKHDIRQNLPSSIFLPVPRADLLELLRMQDKIANIAKNISDLILSRHMTLPEPMRESVCNFLDLALDTSQQAVKAMGELDELVTVGFRGREVQLVERLIKELDRLEHETDQQERQVRAQLFSLESELNPVDVMFLYRILEWIGDLSNRAQQVGSRLQILLAR